MKMGIERVLKEKFADALKDIQQVFDEENRETTVEVLKGPNAPFLMSGCKIADGVGTMLVTSVGSNTGWGLLMASISEDTGEEAPLQVHLNGLATFIGIIGCLLGLMFYVGLFDNFRIIQVTILVVAVPECLPLVITLTEVAATTFFLGCNNTGR
ncbi:putative calcium-transporting ATPase [Rosa chinensis]|uniref:Putative calcium-transporting ATPase n=1 Tax=Rosa chinensis TaxID=74649 RepID=A0A2P6RTD2_ROSCH|nr:putative calcium-transporting ATPase [Rosa chinensis]